MKKLVLGVAAFGVALNLAWGERLTSDQEISLIKQCLTNNNASGCNTLDERAVVRGSLNCKDYMKVAKEGCKLGDAINCVRLGVQLDPTIVADCAIKDSKSALQNYKKACELGESGGCSRYDTLSQAIAREQRRRDDMIDRKDIIIRQR